MRSEHTVLLRVLEMYDSKNQALYNTLDFCVLGKNDVGLSRYAYIFAEKQFSKNLSVNTL